MSKASFHSGACALGNRQVRLKLKQELELMAGEFQPESEVISLSGTLHNHARAAANFVSAARRTC